MLDLRSYSHFRYDPTRDGESDTDSDDTNSDSTDSGEGEGDQVYFPDTLFISNFDFEKSLRYRLVNRHRNRKFKDDLVSFQ